MTFASPSETRFRSLRLGSSPAPPHAEARCFAGLVPSFLSWGFQRSPLRRLDPVRPLPVHLPKEELHRPEAATLRARSVLAVSHDLDGLPRTGLAGLLRPASGHGVRCVSCIRRLASITIANDGLRYLRASAFPAALSPSECSPRQQLLSRLRDRCPLAVCRTPLSVERPAQAPSAVCSAADEPTSGPCSAAESVARPAAQALQGWPDTPMGFPFRGPCPAS